MLGDDVAEIARTLRRGRSCAKRLTDRMDIVIDGLRKANDRETVVVPEEKRGEIHRRRIRIVTTNRMQHVRAILHQWVARDLLRIGTFLDQAAFHAVFHIRQLDAAVPDRAPTVSVQHTGGCTFGGSYFEAVAG